LGPGLGQRAEGLLRGKNEMLMERTSPRSKGSAKNNKNNRKVTEYIKEGKERPGGASLLKGKVWCGQKKI